MRETKKGIMELHQAKILVKADPHSWKQGLHLLIATLQCE